MKSKFLEINYHYEDRINVNMSKEASYRLERPALGKLEETDKINGR